MLQSLISGYCRRVQRKIVSPGPFQRALANHWEQFALNFAQRIRCRIRPPRVYSCLIPARGSEQHIRGSFLQQMCKEIQKVKQRLSAVAYFGAAWRSSLDSCRPRTTIFLRNRWEGKCVSGNGHTGGLK